MTVLSAPVIRWQVRDEVSANLGNDASFATVPIATAPGPTE
jgi:hypothetical protein